MTPDGDDFSQPVKDLLAKRAGFLCCFPNCGARTIGPSEAMPDKSASVGVACHITASRKDGPRFDETLTSDQRRSADNGIWLCQTHSRLIDTNGGVDHPATTLRAWKAAHEEKMARSLGAPSVDRRSTLAGTFEATGAGEVTAIRIRTATEILPGTHARASGTGRIRAIDIGGKDE